MSDDNNYNDPEEYPENTEEGTDEASGNDTPARPDAPKPYCDPADVVRHHLKGMFQTWFLDYASYVILERAVPSIVDGLKPVQRRILYSMYTIDDGHYNKVANIVGNTTHPSTTPWCNWARKTSPSTPRATGATF